MYEKIPHTFTSAQGTTQNALYITRGSNQDKQFTTNYTQKMLKIITIKNAQCIIYLQCIIYTRQFAICTKSMELFELYSKEKANFFA